MSDSIQNPFLTKSFVISSASILNYGDQTFSFYNRITSKKKLYRSEVRISDQQMEQKILKRFQKQLYLLLDESRQSIGEVSISDRLKNENQEKKEDFWDKIRYSQGQRQKIIKNPFGKNSETSSIITSGTTVSNKNKQKNQNPQIHYNELASKNINSRKDLRENLVKVKEKLKIKKQQIKSKETNEKSNQFSVINLYKKKINSNLSNIISFGIDQKKYFHPQSISFRGITYQHVPLNLE